MTQNRPRVGIVNGGGDCPGLNTVIDAVVRSLHPQFEILGFYKSFDGLMNRHYIALDPSFTRQFRFTGGTFLKSTTHGAFAGKTGSGQQRHVDEDVLIKTKKSYDALDLECLVVIGGDGTMTTACQLEAAGLNIIGIPKSIDNDVDKTDFTFGFQTAVEVATEALDRLETTAFSHDRVMVLEVMGRNAGWIALYSGLAGGANVILIPEIESDFEKVADFLRRRDKKNALIVVSEGTRIAGLGQVQAGDTTSSEQRLGGVGDKLAHYLNQFNEFEARCTTLGHIQRGGTPSGVDRLLSVHFGATAAQLAQEKKYGQMVVYQHGEFGSENLHTCVTELKNVNPHTLIIQNAKSLGVNFGDE